MTVAAMPDPPPSVRIETLLVVVATTKYVAGPRRVLPCKCRSVMVEETQEVLLVLGSGNHAKV